MFVIIRFSSRTIRNLVAPVFAISCMTACDQAPASDELKEITQDVRLASVPTLKSSDFSDIGFRHGRYMSVTVVDTFLICTDFVDQKILHVASTRSNKYLGGIVARGKGKGECLGVADVLPSQEQGNIWVYDMTLSKMLKVDIAKALTTSNYTPEEEIVFDASIKGVKSPVLVNDSVFMGCSYYLEDCRYFAFDANSSIISRTGELPDMQEDWPQENPPGKFGLKAMTFSANMTKHPTRDKYMVAYNRTDRLELYEGERLKRIIRGPDFFDPVYTFNIASNGVTIPVENEKTRYSHLQIQSSERYIYSLYSGRDNHKSAGVRTLVFDWDGNPVFNIEMAADVNSAAFMEEGGRIQGFYGIDKATGRVFYASAK